MQIKQFLVIAILLVSGLSAHASDNVRDSNVVKIIDYLRTSLVGPDSVLLQTLVAKLKKANPDVSETNWRAFLSDVSKLVAPAVLTAGEPGAALLRSRLSELTDNDLQNLADFLPSSAFQKYQEAITQPVVMEAGLGKLFMNIQSVMEEIGNSAATHNLKIPQ